MTITFNFQEHFEKLRQAPDRLSESYVERDWFVYYDSLSKDEQKEFKIAFDNYLHGKNEFYEEQIAIGKQMMVDAGIPVS
jgi:hypothetical protein